MGSQREILGKNLKNLIESRGIDQKILAEHLGISEMSVSNWTSGTKYPRINNIQRMADYFGVKKSDLIEDKNNQPIITSSQYPKFPSISAGIPIEIDGITKNEVETISIPDYLMGKWAGNSNIYFTRTNGDSMNRVIPHDSLIAVKPVESHELKNNDIVVYRKHREYAVKRFIRDEDRLIFKPDSTDDRFADDVVYLDNVGDLAIKGKVVMWIVTTD